LSSAARVHRSSGRRRRSCACAVALALALSSACSSSGTFGSGAGAQSAGSFQAGVARYRLRLRDNPVDPGQAFRCYGSCQDRTTPKSYFECLSQCPGFEITPGASCAKHEVPPLAACLTVRKVPVSSEPAAGQIVLAVLGTFLLVVGAASLCAASTSQCGYVQGPY